MSEQVKAISEAFSMQPTMKRVSSQDAFDSCPNSLRKEEMIKEMHLETVCIGHKCGDPIEELYYVGYAFNGNKLFQYLANAVNVEYELTEPK